MMTDKKYKKHTMCEDIVDLNVGDVLVWDNTKGKHDCIVSGCTPALENASYTVKKGTTQNANAVKASTQTYHCECGKQAIEGDPQLIVK
jgi:hypothetical protein